MQFNEVIEALTVPYTQRWTNSASDTRECLALVDLYVRVAWTLTLCESRRNGGHHRPVATPGMGTMLAVVRAAQKDSTFGSDRMGQGLKDTIAKLIQAIDDFRAPSFDSLKSVRNRLDHGEALSTSEVDANSLAHLLRQLCRDIKAALDQQIGAFSFEASGTQVLLITGQLTLVLWPLWVALKPAPHTGLYAHAGSDDVHYLTPGTHQRTSQPFASLQAPDRDWLATQKKQGALSHFAKQAAVDIAAYTEDHTPPDYHFGDDDEAGWLIVPWTRATSDQNQPRLDRFRISQNDEKQWLDSNGAWCPYTFFLKEISNWPVLARRIGIGLAEARKTRRDEEAARLGATPISDARGPARLVEVDSDLRPLTGISFDLKERIDRACELVKPSTEVFFLVGQAGLGKTELMMSAALERAELLKSKPEDASPLYLFVSSTGRTLASLEDAVNSALNITKLLSSQSARVLCRNGLLVLIVDGFDELLGSSGYENALGSLEPWFRDLGGKGVVVASARSSYYLTQYQRSLADSVGLNVDHTLLELQPWSQSEAAKFLEDTGTPTLAFQSLSERDWQLLGVPFFSKAFSAWQRTHSGQLGNQPLFEIVVGQYLDRESSKLKDEHHGAPLLNMTELRALFAEAAEMMLQQRTRELELVELVQCAQMATGIEHIELQRPGLTNRLNAICAMSVNVSTVRKFSFSHEVMLDCFVTILLETALRKGGEFAGVRRLLELTKIQADVFEWLAERCLNESLRCIQQLSEALPDPTASRILSENAGTWWSTILRRQHGVPPSSRAVGLIVDNIELRHGDWHDLTLINCEVRVLNVSEQGHHTVRVPGTKIDQIIASSPARIRATMSDMAPELVSALQVGNEWIDGKRAVRSWFVAQGMAPADAAFRNSEAIDAAEYFLAKIEISSRVQVVVAEQGHLPDDGRLSWTQHYGAQVWTAFLEGLNRHDLAHWEPIQASGKAKVRLTFDIAPARIRRREYDDASVLAFWSEMESAE